MAKWFDGIRVYWDGKKFKTRKGNEIESTPTFFMDGLPDIPLDGFLRPELKNLTRSVNEERWREVQFLLLDAPLMNKPLEERLEFLKHMPKPAHVKVIPHLRCENETHLFIYHEQMVNEGSNGIIIRKPNSQYEHGRTTTMKQLRNYEEADVKFIELSDKGHKLTCELPNGVQCKVTCSSQTYEHPPAPGAVVRIKHSGEYNSTGNVRYPCFVRERREISWADVSKVSF